jgi:homoserine O-acetyltransferase
MLDREECAVDKSCRQEHAMKILSGLCAALAVLLWTYSAPASAHWPDQPPHQTAYLGDFSLERGGVIENLKMTYVTHGKLNAAKDNAILFMHNFGMNHHQFDHLIGPGRPFDTDKYFVICPDYLGSTQTTFEHSTSATNSGLKMKFPFYNGRDVVRANYTVIKEVLGIEHLFAATGIGRGASLSMQLAVSYPDFVDGLVLISGGARWGTTIWLRLSMVVNLIESCDGWQGGNYDENPKRCVTNAMSFFVPYMYTSEWWAQHVDTPEAFTKWRNAWGDYYLDIQDARDIYYLVKSGGHGSLRDTPGFNGDLNAVLRSIKAKTVFIGNPQDLTLVPAHIEAQVKLIPNARAVWIDSVSGHAACCNADPQATRALGEAIRDFLLELQAQPH